MATETPPIEKTQGLIMSLDVSVGETGGLPNDLREVLSHPSFIQRVSAIAGIYRETRQNVDQSFAVWGRRIKRSRWQTAFTTIDFGEIVDNKTSPDFERRIISSEFFRRGRPVLAIVTATSNPEDSESTLRDLRLQAAISARAIIFKNTALITVAVDRNGTEAKVEISRTKDGFDVHKRSNGKFTIVNDGDAIVKTLSPDELLEQFGEYYDIYNSTISLGQTA